jgi:hypothetical protein
LQFFVQVFLRVWIDGDVFSWKVTARLAPRGIAISARKLAQMRADFDRFGPVRHRCRRRDFDVGVIILTLV